MGILGKFKDLVGIEDYDEDEEFEEVQPVSKASDRRQVESRTSFSAPRPEHNDGKVIPMQNRTVSAITSAFKMVVIEPAGFDECPKLVDSLKSKKPIIINLERIESDTARKIFDFLSGATYALNGNVQKVANNIFVFAPENVDISAGVDHKGFSFDNEKKNSNPWK
ncbi:cell division protein SepF [Anaerovorax odorimutans]|uniref:Cell division protein SepF n=1 Tax=Anaerovorax odorimutans TaxID=109327 RepID=A0ABT1RSQ5_9FIRM|nr:cell division protein SepF [Anaerovorax odorimutans]MCQ4637901.1 cell division protein SepF [Anaerovorax odorimutans]